MHELSVCQSIINQLTDIAAQHQAKAVSRLQVLIGPLSGVEPQLLAQAFPLAKAGTLAAEAELDMQLLPIRLHCRQCGRESEASPNRLLCGHCGDWNTQLISGDEMLLANVELITEEEASHV